MTTTSIRHRLLTTTTALSVALGAMPLPLWSQDAPPPVPETLAPEQPEQAPVPPEESGNGTPPEPAPEEDADSAPAAPIETPPPVETESTPLEDPDPAEEAPLEEPAAPADAAPVEEAPAPVEPDPAQPEPEAATPVEQAPSPTEATPPAQAVEVLNSLLGGGAAAGAAAATSDDAPASEATTTEITEQDARSSSEDFTTTASGERRDGDDDRGLSNLQKVGLLALGGLAVGALLSNGDEVVSNTGDRVVVRQNDGQYTVLKDDDALLRQPGNTVRTENFDDGSTRSTVEQADGTRIVTIRDATGRVLRRSRIDASGNELRLIDDTAQAAPVDVSLLPRAGDEVRVSATDRDDLRDALARIEARDNRRSYSLAQIRDYRQVRALAPVVDVQSITFRTGSAAVDVGQAEQLSDLGKLISDLIEENPGEIFLIEGHTDAVGSASSNLALSDRRAESVALALTEYFDVPPENLVVQGYGESDLRIETETDEPRNRRVAVRIITPILQTAGVQ